MGAVLLPTAASPSASDTCAIHVSSPAGTCGSPVSLRASSLPDTSRTSTTSVPWIPYSARHVPSSSIGTTRTGTPLGRAPPADSAAPAGSSVCPSSRSSTRRGKPVCSSCRPSLRATAW
eukprot:scaffold135452_cov32-Tisochrysis_lutea.AAC.2